MALFSDSIVTNGGKSLFAEWLNGGTLSIDNAACGSGTYSVISLVTQTALYNQIKTISIIKATQEDDGIKIAAQISSTGVTESFTVNQFGIWASLDGGDSTMIAIFQDSTGIIVPAFDEMPDFTYTVYLTINTSNVGDFTFTTDPSGIVTQEMLEEAIYTAVEGITPASIGADTEGAAAAVEELLGTHKSSTTPHGGGYATCNTASGTTVKTATLEGYELIKGGLVAVHFTNSAPAMSTININSQGAISIYYAGISLAADVITAGMKVLLQYDGTKYNIISRDFHKHGNISSGGSISDSGTAVPNGFVVTNSTDYMKPVTTISARRMINRSCTVGNQGSSITGWLPVATMNINISSITRKLILSVTGNHNNKVAGILFIILHTETAGTVDTTNSIMEWLDASENLVPGNWAIVNSANAVTLYQYINGTHQAYSYEILHESAENETEDSAHYWAFADNYETSPTYSESISATITGVLSHILTADKIPTLLSSAAPSASLYSDRFYNLGTLASNRTQILAGLQSPPDSNYHVWSGKITITSTSYDLTFMTEELTPFVNWKTDDDVTNNNGTLTFASNGTYYFSVDTNAIGMIVKMI